MSRNKLKIVTIIIKEIIKFHPFLLILSDLYMTFLQLILICISIYNLNIANSVYLSFFFLQIKFISH